MLIRALIQNERNELNQGSCMILMPRLRSAIFPKDSVILLSVLSRFKDSLPLCDGGQQIQKDECSCAAVSQRALTELKASKFVSGAVSCIGALCLSCTRFVSPYSSVQHCVSWPVLACVGSNALGSGGGRLLATTISLPLDSDV